MLNGNRDSDATAAEQIKTNATKTFPLRMRRAQLNAGCKKLQGQKGASLRPETRKNRSVSSCNVLTLLTLQLSHMLLILCQFVFPKGVVEILFANHPAMMLLFHAGGIPLVS